MNDDLDAVDVDRVLGGELDAFTGIVRRWQGPLVTLAFRYCRDRDEAEDMAQIAFLKVFEALGQWRGEGRFGSWLFAVASNVYRSEMRKRRWRFQAITEVTGSIPAGVGGEAHDIADRNSIIRQAVSALPAKYRDTLLLYYFHQMDVWETSSSLGVAEGTVKARLSRGRSLLKRKLRHLLGDNGWIVDNER